MLPRLLLALGWVIVGGLKVIAPGPLPEYLQASGLVDTLGIEAAHAALLLGLCEASVGLLLLFAWTAKARAVAIAASAIMALTMFVFLMNDSQAGNCGCLGALFHVTRGQRMALIGALLTLTGLSLTESREAGPATAG